MIGLPGRTIIDRANSNEAAQPPLILVPNQAIRDGLLAERWQTHARPASLVDPGIEVLSDWMTRLERHTALWSGESAPLAPDRWHLRETWRNVLRPHMGWLPENDLAALTRQCIQADRLLLQWIPDPQSLPGGRLWTDFLGWRDTVARQMDQAGWDARRAAAMRLAQQIRHGAVPAGLLQRPLVWVGFAELTLAEKELFGALTDAGIACERRAVPSMDGRLTLHHYADAASELAGVAQWVESLLDGGAKRVAIIVPGLSSQRESVAHGLQNRLDPGSAWALSGAEQSRVHLAEGGSLARHPMIASALTLLELSLAGHRASLPFPHISQWLRSPGWAGANAEHAARCRLDAELRDTAGHRISLAEVLETARRTEFREALPQLVTCLEALQSWQAQGRAIACFLDALSQWGWGESAVASPDLHAVVARFRTMLESLDRVSGNHAPQAFALLVEACSEATSPGLGGALSPIQVLSPESAYGQRFDACAVMSLTDDAWPPRAANNALLSPSARALVPRAEDSGMQNWAGRVTAALRGCAPEVRMSWHRATGETPHFPSPLIDTTQAVQHDEVTDTALWRPVWPDAAALKRQDHPWLRTRPDAPGHALPTPVEVRGIVSVLDLQSSCPLAAYLAFRLGARPLNKPGAFLDNADRGNLVHDVLRRLYDAAGHRADRQQVPDLVDAALDQSTDARRLPPLMRRMESERLQSLVQDWMRFEDDTWTHRPSVVEHEGHFEFRGLRFRLRPDRIDRSVTEPEAGQFLIDYKTGTVPGTTPWADERPYALQLPLYAVVMADHDPVAGVAFAGVRHGALNWQGITGSNVFTTKGISDIERGRSKLAKAHDDWDDCLHTWRLRLETLADELLAGDARHQLFHAEGLAWCGLEPVMRSGQLQAWMAEVEVADEP